MEETQEKISTLDYLNTLMETLEIVREVTELLADMTQPTLTDMGLMKPLVDEMEKMLDGEDTLFKRKVELFVLLYHYAPIKIVNGKFCKHDNLLTHIAKVFRVSTSNLSYMRKILMDYYNPKYNPKFYKTTNHILESLDVEGIRIKYEKNVKS